LTKQVKAAQASSNVNNTVSTNDVDQKSVVSADTSQVLTNEQSQVNAVVQQYQPSGPSEVIPASEAHAEDQAVASVQADAMWQSYCQAVPASTTSCAGIPTNTSAPATTSAVPAAPTGASAVK
jgi:hypothetical protein